MYLFFDGKVFAIIFPTTLRAGPVLGYGSLTYRNGWPLTNRHGDGLHPCQRALAQQLPPNPKY